MGLETWIEHVRATAKRNNTTYMCAIPEAARTYKLRKKFLAKKSRVLSERKQVQTHKQAIANVNRARKTQMANELSRVFKKRQTQMNKNQMNKTVKKPFSNQINSALR